MEVEMGIKLFIAPRIMKDNHNTHHRLFTDLDEVEIARHILHQSTDKRSLFTRCTFQPVAANATKLLLFAIAKGKTTRVEGGELGSDEMLVRDHSPSRWSPIKTFCHSLQWLHDYYGGRFRGGCGRTTSQPRPAISASDRGSCRLATQATSNLWIKLSSGRSK
jgi:hypothetical protein